MTRIRNLFRDRDGVATIEMAFALPIMIIMMWMILQAGLVFRAMSGIQHALGEGARAATLYSTKTDAQVEDEIKDKIDKAVYGIGPGDFDPPTLLRGTADGSRYIDLTVTYTQPTDLLLLPGPTITVSRSKRVWVAT